MANLTVVIVTHNRCKLLDRTLQSLTRQTHTDFRVITVDHGSTDHPEEAAARYAERLQLTHYRIERENVDFAPSVPRDFGARKAESNLILFMDSGAIAPPWFIEAHIQFHQTHANAVGIGLLHNYRPLEDQSDSQREIREVTDFQQAYLELKEAHLLDQRANLDLERIPFPWFFGWSANISCSRAAYLATGGFDTTIKGWGFEDTDFCYRLYKDGYRPAFVENGWLIELTQERLPTPERFQTTLHNMRYCYDKQRTLVLEAMALAFSQMYTWVIASVNEDDAKEADQQIGKIAVKMLDQFFVQAIQVFQYLQSLQPEKPVFAEKPDFAYARPALLIGGTEQDGEHFDYLTLGNEEFRSTAKQWSSFGILLPQAGQKLETVVVSPIWKKLGWSIRTASGLVGTSLLEKLVSEIQRTARRAIFIEDPTSENEGISQVELAEMCTNHQLEFQIIALAPAQ